MARYENSEVKVGVNLGLGSPPPEPITVVARGKDSVQGSVSAESILAGQFAQTTIHSIRAFLNSTKGVKPSMENRYSSLMGISAFKFP